MTNSNEEGPGIAIAKTEPRLTPPGYKIQLSTKQAIAIAEFTDSQVFKILEQVYGAQRKDHIARSCLNGSQDERMLHYYKGMAAEVVLFFQNMKAIKKSLNEDEKQ